MFQDRPANTIGERVRVIRLAHHLSQQGLARRLSISQTGVSYIEVHASGLTQARRDSLIMVFSEEEVEWILNGSD